MSDKTGGPAFPIVEPPTAGHSVTPGMTLRDYFAAKVMQTLVMGHLADSLDWNAHEEADIAYQIADAMLKAREQS